MAKRKRGFTREKYEKWIKEGRGQGEGADYKPWLLIQDVPSKGKCSRILGIKTKRQHELFSDNEANYFYSIDFSEPVIDIREQFPLLPIEDTIGIAQELGIKHPTDPKSQEVIVITTDFLISTVDENGKRLLARTVKQHEDLNSERQMEKFEIERRYWLHKGIDWGVVSEKEINETLAKNIELVYQFCNLKDLVGFQDLSPERLKEIVDEFKKEIIGVSTNIREKSHEFEERMLLEVGCGISIFKHLIITKQISISMTEPINIDKPIEIKRLEERELLENENL
ncbi:MAG: hypothetical protein ACI8WT_001379 [Clostridium sp.]|jgi:hypothetical protein